MVAYGFGGLGMGFRLSEVYGFGFGGQVWWSISGDQEGAPSVNNTVSGKSQGLEFRSLLAV